VHAPAERFWRALKAGERNAVAAEIRYPIKVTLNGKIKTLHNAAELLAEAKKLNIDITPTSGEDVEKLIEKLFATPPAVAETVRKTLGR
jgi:hypothetical protein